MQKVIKVWLSVWPYLIVVVAGVLIGITICNWAVWSMQTKLVALGTALLPFHVLEEWLFPGGFFFGYNTLVGSDVPDRYPLNQLSDMWTNSIGILCGCAFLLIGVTPMFALVQFLLCLVEVAAHSVGGAVALKRFRARGKRTIYNPGLVTVFIGYLPLAICFIVSFRIEAAPTTPQVLGGIGCFIVLALLAIVLPEQLCKDKDTPYAFSRGRGYFEKFREDRLREG